MSAELVLRVAPPESALERRALAWRRIAWRYQSDEVVQALQEILRDIDADPRAGNDERFMVQVNLAHALLRQSRAEEALPYSRAAEVTARALGVDAEAAARQLQQCTEIMLRESVLEQQCQTVPFW